VIGGGITGAAVLREAARRGLRATLIERDDYASGASSRSSKLVHGGLRYLKEGKFGLTRESVREREELLRDAPGLVEPIRFLMPHYPGSKPGARTLGLGLALYDRFAGRRSHRYVERDEALRLAPAIKSDGLTGAHEYGDATTDDARMVLRLLQDAREAGAHCINYTEATELIERKGRIRGAQVVDRIGKRTAHIDARVVVNAGGFAADLLRESAGAKKRLRPLRGSHLVLPGWRLPLAQSVAFSHPRDGRPVFAYPWLGVTLVGTTDVDHDDDPRSEPFISPEESAYLLEALAHQFPSSAVAARDCIASYAGVRPVVDSGAKDPSKESRDAAVWDERGLITVTGGKLTTFRPMAMATLHAAAKRLGRVDLRERPAFERTAPPDASSLDATQLRRLAGCYGSAARALLAQTPEGDREPVGGSMVLWAELRWAARHEQVVHLDDLLLRRTRLGLIAPQEHERHRERLRAICRDELGWSDERFEREAADYRDLHARHYGAPA
jgi:glycerol-3-phosphate dehydrogenase